MAQVLLVLSSIAMATVAAFTYRASFDDAVREGGEVLTALPAALERSFPDTQTFSLNALEQWRVDPMLVDRIGAHATSRQFADSCGGKEEVWYAHVLRDALGELPPEFFSEPPYLHLSGSSYVMLAVGMDPERFGHRDFLARHRAFVHVSELVELQRFRLTLTDPERWVASLDDTELFRLAEGAELLLGSAWLFLGTLSDDGDARYRVYPRAQLERFLAERGLAIAEGTCVRTMDGLCVASDPAHVEAQVSRAQAFGGGSIALLLIAAVGGAVRRGRERRDEERQRLFVLQTLSHELRTPATSLALSVEPVRSHFDELPHAVQPAFLRICDNVQRLQRMVDASSQYLRGEGGTLAILPINVPDVHDLIDELAGELGARADLELPARPGRLDAYWAGVCVRNLVENARHHGAEPITIAATASGDDLVITVEDAGPGLSVSLDEAIRPFVARPTSPGLGFGLAVVDRMTRAMGGRLRYAPDPTRFTLELPGVFEP